MRQNSAVDVGERFGRAVEGVRNLLDEHARLCAERVAAAEAAAQGDISRFAQASEQLTDARRELADRETERASLPLAAYTAGMNGDTALESELRARYQEIEPGHLDHLRGRIETLAAEVASLGGDTRGAERRAHGFALEAYGSVLADLGRFEDQIAGLREAVAEARAKLGNGQRAVEEHLQLLRQLERDERHEERREAARSAEARRAVTGTRGRVIG
ncbi:MAG: hypothetical protein M3R38_16180 [Actinomycetota bacterium]|nr:hypothetical protein [Actinomycetota bacterium]